MTTLAFLLAMVLVSTAALTADELTLGRRRLAVEATLPESGRTYRFAVTVANGRIPCYVDDRLLHSYDDPAPHRQGKLAFRTFRARLWWDNLRAYRLLRPSP